jgi:hypothetical protein
MLVPDMSFQFVCGKARSLPNSGTPEGCFTRLGSGLTHKHQTRLERPSSDKRSSVLRILVTYFSKYRLL